jgi:hypothetical protein
MNLATRKAIYTVYGTRKQDNGEFSFETKCELTARNVYNDLKEREDTRSVLFTWRKPTVTKGQIDPDLYE